MARKAAPAAAKPGQYVAPEKQSFVPVYQDSAAPDVLTPQVIGCDNSNGVAQFARLNEKAKRGVDMISIPHGRVTVDGAELSSDLAVQGMEYRWNQWRDRRFGFGLNIEIATAKKADTSRNHRDRYGSDYWLWSLFTGISELGVSDAEPIVPIICIPPSYGTGSDSVVPHIKAALRAGNCGEEATFVIQPDKSKKPLKYRISHPVIMLEGMPAYAAYLFDLKGNPVDIPDPRYPNDQKHAFSGNVVILDGGYGTFDTYRVVNGQVIKTTLGTATDPQGGIQERMIKPIQNLIFEETKLLVSEMLIDVALQNWANSGYQDEAAVLLVGGKVLKLGKVFFKLATEYSEWIATNKIAPEITAGADAFCIVGGSFNFAINDIRLMYPQRLFITPEMTPHLKHVAKHELNGYGALAYYAAMKRGQ